MSDEFVDAFGVHRCPDCGEAVDYCVCCPDCGPIRDCTCPQED